MHAMAPRLIASHVLAISILAVGQQCTIPLKSRIGERRHFTGGTDQIENGRQEVTLQPGTSTRATNATPSFDLKPQAAWKPGSGASATGAGSLPPSRNGRTCKLNTSNDWWE